jgi:ribosomal protein S18 acetylase RimI-like enzyme
MTWQRDGYGLSDDKSRLDRESICRWLQATYWASDRSREVIEKSIEHSMCFGMFRAGAQVGFARIVTDSATFAYICDVFVAPELRGRGLGKWMMECVLAHPVLQTCTLCLRTRDAHGLYEPLGFERTEYLRRSQSDWSKPKPLAE